MDSEETTIKNLTLAHMSALTKTLEAIEVQITALKSVISKLDAEDEDEEVEEKPKKKAAKKKSTKKKKPVEEDEDLEDDEDEEDDSFEDDEDEEESVTKQDVIKALQKYAKKHSKAKAVNVMKRVTKKASIHDVDPSKYDALLAKLN